MKTIIEVDVAPNEKIIKLNLARTEHDGFQVEYTTYNFRIIEPAQAVPDEILQRLHKADAALHKIHLMDVSGEVRQQLGLARGHILLAVESAPTPTSDTAPSGLVADDEC